MKGTDSRIGGAAGTAPQTRETEKRPETAEQRDRTREELVLACAEGMADGRSPYPALQIPGGEDGTVRDLALVMCHHGTDPARLAAAKAALAWTLAARPAPALTVIAEAQDEGTGPLLAEIPGTVHVLRAIPPEGKGIWLKEALWTTGAQEALKDPEITKLCFLDIDVSFADQGWAKAVSEALETHDLISPHSHLYYADQPDASPLGVMPSAGLAIAERKGNGMPGLAAAMTREFFEKRLGGRIEDVCVGSGDVYLWVTAAGKTRYPVSQPTYPHSLTAAEVAGMTPPVRIGTAGQLAVHRGHGPFRERCYRQRAVLCRACSPATGECLSYDGAGMPVWRDTPGGRILREAYPELLELAKDHAPSPREAREIYDRLALKEYGATDAEHPLVVTCLLRSGGPYGPRHVRWLRDQFARHCLADFRFVCQTDVPVAGVETVPLEFTAREAPGWWSQVEHFRNIWPENASVLTCDLDTVVFGDFVPHRCPDGRFFMLREYGNWHRSEWAVWGGGLTYSRGDFSFIPDMFRKDTEAGGQASPLFGCIAPQEFVTSCLRARGIRPEDIESHFCCSYYQGRTDSIRPEAHFAVFPAQPKPWEISPRPAWIPELPAEQEN